MTFIWGMSIEDSWLNQSSPLRRSCRDSALALTFSRRAFAHLFSDFVRVDDLGDERAREAASLEGMGRVNPRFDRTAS